MLKAAVKRLAPVAALNMMRRLNDERAIRAAPAQGFDASTLGPMPDIRAIMENADAARHWSEDAKAIERAYGSVNVPGGVNPGDRRAIYHLVHALKPRAVLEIGTHIASSTVAIGLALQRVAVEEDWQVTTVDLADVNAPGAAWSKIGLRQPPRELLNVVSPGLGARIRFLHEDATAFLKQAGERFDLVFLDGDHAASTVYREVALALRLLQPGGAILLHDYYPGRALFADRQIFWGPRLGMQRVQKEAPAIHVKPLGPLPWPTKQGSAMTSLALVSVGGKRRPAGRNS